uniref:Integrase core domain containing protein n=1 Tax=Solanum tuberosum TaxID=4113 RepID=M1DQ34_SOLTU
MWLLPPPRFDEGATPIGSLTGSEFSSSSSSVSGSNSNGVTSSSSEASSASNIPVPLNTDHAPVPGDPNRWCVHGQYQIYRDACILTEKERMTRLVIEERRVLTGSLHTAPDIHHLFQRHRFLYGPGHPRPINMAEFDYRMDIIPSGAVQRNAKQWKSHLCWLAHQLATDGECVEWFSTPSLALVAGLEADFARMLIVKIHERAFKATTTLPFP